MAERSPHTGRTSDRRESASFSRERRAGQVRAAWKTADPIFGPGEESHARWKRSRRRRTGAPAARERSDKDERNAAERARKRERDEDGGIEKRTRLTQSSVPQLMLTGPGKPAGGGRRDGEQLSSRHFTCSGDVVRVRPPARAPRLTSCSHCLAATVYRTRARGTRSRSDRRRKGKKKKKKERER